MTGFVLSLSVPGQPGKFKVGKVTDASIELTWEPVYNKEKIIKYELLYRPVKFGSVVSSRSLLPYEWDSQQHNGAKQKLKDRLNLTPPLTSPPLFIRRSPLLRVAGDAELRAEELLHRGGSESKHGVLLLPGCHVKQRHRSVH